MTAPKEANLKINRLISLFSARLNIYFYFASVFWHFLVILHAALDVAHSFVTDHL